MFYTLIKHGFLTNQSSRKNVAILYRLYTDKNMGF